MFQAAHDAGAKRMVFASSIHAIDGYPEDVLVFPEMSLLAGTCMASAKSTAKTSANTSP